MSIYKLIKHIANYSKISRNLWYYFRDETVLNYIDNLSANSAANNNSVTFGFKTKVKRKTRADDTENVEIIGDNDNLLCRFFYYDCSCWQSSSKININGYKTSCSTCNLINLVANLSNQDNTKLLL